MNAATTNIARLHTATEGMDFDAVRLLEAVLVAHLSLEVDAETFDRCLELARRDVAGVAL